MNRKLEKKMRADAEKDLQARVDLVRDYAAGHAADMGVVTTDLLKIAVGGRVASIRGACVTRLVRKAGEELEALYNQQRDIEDPPDPAPGGEADGADIVDGGQPS